ncbi:lipoate-protein ligase [Clostridium amylolyticum]|uniref:lipoate--protein ligase n=1 Tax=Clostridium amylolyticum TaxID=1121298 RepID=A0A1M6PCR8_9CLOT|nr:lipoate--protein ligase [Clostridium amylolyticum]SHK05753.1 lipoate-protein ligase [Clostridium amylolyticum]
MLNKLKAKVVYSNSYDPWFNLALEEYLLNSISEDEVIFYLWQNQNTVVIGNNQNSWKECRIDELNSDDGKLVRRLSGGGAVFHDLGNLNFTFLASNDNFDINKQLHVILHALKDFGINAEFSGRNDIEVFGKKFSGNAFYYGDKGNYHHGTLLVDVNMSKLSKYLKVSESKIKSKGIDSVKARVINLKEINPLLIIEDLKTSLVRSFCEVYSVSPEEYVVDESTEEIKELYEKYSSWNFIYGESPEFDIEYENRFSFGNVQLCLKVNNGTITQCKVFTDALDTIFPTIIETALKGVPFQKEAIIKAIQNTQSKTSSSIIEEFIIKWIGNLI